METDGYAWTDEDHAEARDLAERFSGRGGRSHRLLATLTLETIKSELDVVSRWRLVKRYRLVREAKLIAKDAGLVHESQYRPFHQIFPNRFSIKRDADA